MKLIETKNIFNGFLKIDELTFENKENKIIKRQIMNRGDSVASIVYNTETKKFIFVKQFRPGSMSEIVELVAGSMDVDGEETIDAMTREVEEELGYAVDEIKFLNSFYVSPGGTSEKIHLFVSKVSKKISDGGGVEDEDIEIVEMTEEEIEDFPFEDAKTIIAVLFLMS